MATLICERCHQQYGSRRTLIKHLVEGIICEPLFSSRSKEEIAASLGYSPRNIECPHCKNLFKSQEFLNEHTLACPIILQRERKELCDLRVLQTQFGTQQKRLSDMETIINRLSEKCKMISEMKLFNYENTDYIDDDPSIITKCVKNGIDGMMEYIKLKYFHPEHKENYTLKKWSTLKIYNGAKWKPVSDEYVLSRIIEDYQFKVLAFIRQNKDKADFDMTAYERFLYDIAYPLDLDILFLDIWELPEEDDECLNHKQQTRQLIHSRIMETIQSHTRLVKRR